MSLSELLKDVQLDLSTITNLTEKNLKDDKFLDDLKTVLKIAKIGFSDATGGALHRLHISKPSIETVKELVQGNPDALPFKNEEDQLPIQSAVWNQHAVKYIPILAKEGIKHEVGGRGMRGGLLLVDPGDEDDLNTLQSLANMGISSDPIPYDTACLDAMKELRKENILLKKDIKDHSLLFWSCHLRSKMRFEYLAEWDPDCLMTGTFRDLPLSHAIIEHSLDLTCFTLFLTTSLKHHPKHLGLLFQKDSSRKTAYERAIEKHGIDETFNVVQQCIPSNTSLPILHHVIRDAPQHINDFCIRYPSAWHLRDENGRSINQAQLAEGTKTVANDGLFFMKLTDDEIAEVDPVTKQYPFLVVATGAASDLSTIFYLLSKNPSLLERYREQVTLQNGEEARTKKRKRDNDENDEDDG